jgi:hypothetical protein
MAMATASISKAGTPKSARPSRTGGVSATSELREGEVVSGLKTARLRASRALLATRRF